MSEKMKVVAVAVVGSAVYLTAQVVLLRLVAM
jgi:hypothetical protein